MDGASEADGTDVARERQTEEAAAATASDDSQQATAAMTSGAGQGQEPQQTCVRPPGSDQTLAILKRWERRPSKRAPLQFLMMRGLMATMGVEASPLGPSLPSLLTAPQV